MIAAAVGTGVPSLTIRVTGAPAPKGSVTRLPNGGYVQGRDTAERTRIRSWATAVTEAADRAVEEAGWQRLRGPCALEVTFLMAPVKSDRYRTRHVSSPDLDKLVRNTADALKDAGVMADDALICDIVARKRYASDGHTGAVVKVHCLGEAESVDRDRLKHDAASARRAISAQDALL